MSRLSFSSFFFVLSFACFTVFAQNAATPFVMPTSATTPADTFTRTIVERLDGLLVSPLFERSQVGILVYDLTADAPLYDRGARQRMRPASTMKLITAILALDKLGGAHQLKTQLLCTAPLDSVVRGDLVVRGGFDPLFSTDDMRSFVSVLQRAGVQRIEGNLWLDTSMKSEAAMGWGWCWDDDMVRLTPLLYRGKDGFSDAWVSALQEAKIGIVGQLRVGKAPAATTVLATRSHSIDQVLIPMMKKSDNLFAESLFYQIVALSNKAGATRTDALPFYNRFFTDLRLNPNLYQVADGSGLSLYNYVSPELLVAALRYAYLREEIYNHLFPTLPIMGRDGTLRNRGRGTSAQGNVFAKTGSVDGVSALAGYATSPNGHLLAFAIINQGVASMAEGRSFQDRVCRALTERISPLQIIPDTMPEAQPELPRDTTTRTAIPVLDADAA